MKPVSSLVRLRGGRRHLAAIASAAVIVYSIFFVGSVTAYVGHSPYNVSLTRSSVRSCSDTGAITATVRDAKTQKLVRFQTVIWSFASTRSSKDKVMRRSSTTNSHGQASTSIRFGPKAGTRTVYASVGGFKSRTTASCAQAAQPTPKPTKKPHQPDKTPKPTPKPTPRPTQKPAQATARPTKKPHHEPTPGLPTEPPVATPSAVSATLPVGGITPSPIDEASASPSSTLTAVVDSTGAPASTTNPAVLPASDAGQGGGGGPGFDFGLIALLVIGALGALVVVFLVRQPTRARR